MNVKYLRIDKEKRLQKLSMFIKHLVEPADEYYAVKESIMKYARENDAPVSDIRLSGYEYPDNVEW